MQKNNSKIYSISFLGIIGIVCSFLLAFTANILKPHQIKAKQLNQTKEMLSAALVLDNKYNFQLVINDYFIQAKLDHHILTPNNSKKRPKNNEKQIQEFSKYFIRPLVTDRMGNIYSIEECNIDPVTYFNTNKHGYQNLEKLLFFAVLKNKSESKNISAEDLKTDLSSVDKYIFPIYGHGLWGPIYGFLSLKKDLKTIVGTSWYDHIETPGLGANIANSSWKSQFFNKNIFQTSKVAPFNPNTSKLGIITTKGFSSSSIEDKTLQKSYIDGISGATQTCNGVCKAYEVSMEPFRQFLIRYMINEK